MKQPIVLITRPVDAANKLRDHLLSKYQDEIDVIVSPLLEIVPTKTEWDGGDVDGLIFTSAHGVDQAARLGFRTGPAWCVGDETARVAAEKGFDAQSANGDSQALIEAILKSKPTGTWLHIRGKNGAGDVVRSLRDADVDAHQIIAYRQKRLNLTESAVTALNGESKIIVPLYSPRTAVQFNQEYDGNRKIFVVAMSNAVAKPVREIAEALVVADHPDQQSMSEALDLTIGRFVLEKTEKKPHMGEITKSVSDVVTEDQGDLVSDDTNKPEIDDDVEQTTEGAAIEVPLEEEDVQEDSDDALEVDESEIEDVVAEEPSEELPELEPAQDDVAQPAPQRSGFVPTLLGGLIAGAIGYGAAYLQFGQTGAGDLDALVASHDQKLTDLESRIATAEQGPDLTSLQSADQDLSTQMSDLATSVQTNLDALADRIDQLEKRPLADGSLSSDAVAQYEQELGALQTQMNDVVAQLDSASDISAQAMQAAASQAALGRLQASIETGAPFSAPLSELEASGISIPEILSQTAASGVPSNANLADVFPDFARQALAAARAEGLTDTSGGIGAFFANQLNVRSVEPREGSDPDAILSRAEAAMNEGRLSDAVAEVSSLPEVVRAVLSDWLSDAQLRLDAIQAAQSLSQTLSQN